MKLTQSEVSLYRTCPLQFHGRKHGVFGPIAPFDVKVTFIGHLLQKLVELFYEEQWWKSQHLITHFRSEVPRLAGFFTQRDNVKWLPGELEEKLRIAHESVNSIVNLVKREKLLSTNVKTELAVETPISKEDSISGRLDFLIERKEDTLLLDGKAGASYGRYIDKDQLRCYAMGIPEPKTPLKAGFWWFRHEKIQWVKLEPAKQTFFLEEAQKVFAGVKAENWQATPGSHCRMCPYRMECSAGRKYMQETATQVALDIEENCATISL